MSWSSRTARGFASMRVWRFSSPSVSGLLQPASALTPPTHRGGRVRVASPPTADRLERACVSTSRIRTWIRTLDAPSSATAACTPKCACRAS